MTRIYLPSEGAVSWQHLLADPVKHWRTGYSARTLAECWEAADGIPPEISDMFRAIGKDPELLIAIPEHKVPLPGSRRGESQNDLFVLLRVGDRTVAVAFEGKVNEPFDRRLGEWLKDASLASWNASSRASPQATRCSPRIQMSPTFVLGSMGAVGMVSSSGSAPVSSKTSTSPNEKPVRDRSRSTSSDSSASSIRSRSILQPEFKANLLSASRSARLCASLNPRRTIVGTSARPICFAGHQSAVPRD